jgi:antitoxin FitA
LSSITLDFQPEQFAKLQSLADRLGVSVEGLARSTIEELLSAPDDKFEQAAEYLLQKNEELYRRLA